MEENEVTFLLTALVKQLGGEVFVYDTTVRELEGGLALYVDPARAGVRVKYITSQEAEELEELND